MSVGYIHHRKNLKRLNGHLNARKRKGKNMKRRSREITQKERDLLQLIANGWKDGEVKEQLGISESTIRNRLGSLFVKTETFNRPQLVYWACKHEII